MPNKQEKAQMKDKAKEMLAKYLPTKESRLFGRVVGHSSSPSNSTAHRHNFFIIDKMGDGFWIVNVNLYISNLLGYRMDKNNNLVTRDTQQDIAQRVGDAIGHDVKVWST